MQPNLLFFGNVAAHLVALMSGVVSFIIAFIEAWHKKPLVSRWFWIAGGCCLLYACDGAWQDEHRNTENVKIEKAEAFSAANQCRENARVEHASFMGLQGLNAAQRETIDKQQLSNDAQQKDVSSCVVSLGRLNPKVREQFTVITVPIATTNSSGRFVDSSTTLVVRYLLEVLIVTNESEPRFHGNIRCDKAFKVVSPPANREHSANSIIHKVPTDPRQRKRI